MAGASTTTIYVVTKLTCVMFVATKHVLVATNIVVVAAPVNDIVRHQWQELPQLRFMS